MYWSVTMSMSIAGPGVHSTVSSQGAMPMGICYPDAYIYTLEVNLVKNTVDIPLTYNLTPTLFHAGQTIMYVHQHREAPCH